MEREIVPLSKRPLDIVILAFFVINILFITYIVDVEQLVIANPDDFEYPPWPLPFMVDIIHWYGRNFDPVLIAWPMWWKMIIWLDSLFFGPFYVAAIYAFARGREWIRIPSIVWASVLVTNVLIILGEEFGGTHPTPAPVLVFFLNLPWLLWPVLVIARMWRAEHPFTREAGG